MIGIDEEGNELRKGDVWFVYLPGETGMRKVQLVDVTERTVEIMAMPFSYRMQRYEISRVRFVEKVEK